MKDSATIDINSEQPIYLKGKFFFYLAVGTILSIFIALLISVIALRWINPPTTSFMLQQNWKELQVERYSLRDHWVDYKSLPKHSAWAVVASEDQLFWQHGGFDFESIQDAWDERRKGVRSRGASSITQQVAKNIYLWPAESFFRKGVEAGITLLIELFWSKERIIEVYLNIAEFGPGVFGIGMASDHFFDRNATQLEPDMTARLAAVLPNPKRMRVNPPSPYAKERSRWILRQMTQLSGTSYVSPQTIRSNESQPVNTSATKDRVITSKTVKSISFRPAALSADTSKNIRVKIDSTLAKSLPDSTLSF